MARFLFVFRHDFISADRSTVASAGGIPQQRILLVLFCERTLFTFFRKALPQGLQ